MYKYIFSQINITIFRKYGYLRKTRHIANLKKYFFETIVRILTLFKKMIHKWLHAESFLK